MKHQGAAARRWKLLDAQVHARCRVYDILREQWQEEGGRRADFFVMDVRDWAMALALTPADELVLVRQFRFGSGSLTWEMPAGLVDPGEDPAVAAARELFEESGFRGAEPVLLGSVHPNPAIQRNRCHVYLIADARGSGMAEAPDEHESFDVAAVPMAEVRRMATDGRLSHAIVLTALYLLDQARANGTV